MANAKKCDRCGKFFDPYIKPRGMKTGKYYKYIRVCTSDLADCVISADKAFELCESCLSSFGNWARAFDQNGAPSDTMCSKCAKCNTEACHCDCTREFEPTKQQTDESNEWDDDEDDL